MPAQAAVGTGGVQRSDSSNNTSLLPVQGWRDSSGCLNKAYVHAAQPGREREIEGWRMEVCKQAT
jgi:hypothetical protein